VLADPLNGVAPIRNRLDAYPVDAAAGDLFRGASDAVAAKWHQLANGMAGSSDAGLAAIHEQVARQILDLGLTFRIAGDEDERDWPLTPMPLIVGAEEWAGVERGLIQRASLLEQVVADQGTLIIYAPHIHEVSRTWGRHIEAVGYHIREYLLAHMDRLKDVPRGVLAHLTHVRGTGTYTGGVERPDVNLVFATSIPEDVCRRINFVDHAGEILHRLTGPVAAKE